MGWFWCHDDVTGSRIWNRQALEDNQRHCARDWLDEGMTVLDIGANQGLYTLLAAKRCGKTGRVFAFEPCRRERLKLRWNLLTNLCTNVTVCPEAVGKSPATDLTLYAVVGRETGGNSLRPPAADLATATKKQAVRMTSVDAFCERRGLACVDFIKLDVEGGELDVLRGAQRLLSQPSRPVILMEVSDVRTAAWGYAAREMVTFLAEQGYGFFEIEEGRLIRHIPEQAYHKDLMAVPMDSIGTFTAKMSSRGWQVRDPAEPAGQG